MADNLRPDIRRLNMSRIRSGNTKPEMLVRKYLHQQGFRYRLHCKHLFGKPDIVLKKHKVVLFVHGCFWHGHDGCNRYVIPKTRIDYWLAKISRNKERDLQVCTALKNSGWRVVVVWECQLRSKLREDTLKALVQHITA